MSTTTVIFINRQEFGAPSLALSEHLVPTVTHHIGDKGMSYIECKLPLQSLQRIAVHCVQVNTQTHHY